MIIVFSGSKGGIGKSTTTYQVAGYMHYKRFKYIVFDVDIANRTISTINDYVRKKEKLNIKMVSDSSELERLISHAKLEYDFIIIDTGGNIDTVTQKAIVLADKIITPISHDAITEIVGFTRFKSVLKKLFNPKIHVSFCNVHSRTKNFSEMIEQLKKYPNMEIMKHGLKTRSIYKISLKIGVSVQEMKSTKNKEYNKNLNKAKKELSLLIDEIITTQKE